MSDCPAPGSLRSHRSDRPRAARAECAFALLLLLFVPWLIKKTKISSLLDESGHGELFLLLGVMIPLAGASLFYATGLKPDLGAVVFGVLLAGHPRAGEMAKAMMGFKDLFLIGFFLGLGL